MTTPRNPHRPPPFVVVAAAGLAGALLGVTPHSAHAIPERGDPPTTAGRAAPATGHFVERACFIKPLTWNEASDGPLPRCYTYVPH